MTWRRRKFQLAITQPLHSFWVKGVGQPLRIALTGSKFGPGIYDIIISLGKEEVTKRLANKKLG